MDVVRGGEIAIGGVHSAISLFVCRVRRNLPQTKRHTPLVYWVEARLGEEETKRSLADFDDTPASRGFLASRAYCLGKLRMPCPLAESYRSYCGD